MRTIRAAAVVLALVSALYGQEKLIYETDSLYHHIVVSETGTTRILRFHKGPAEEALGSDFAQSAVLLADPYSLYMRYTKYSMAGAALLKDPKRALFIGLGAGTLPKFFARAFPECRVDVAELDGEVYAVARKYFFLPEMANLKVTIMDGRLFVRASEEKYDFIMIDAYRDDMIPFHLMTQEFLVQVKEALAPNGLLVSNIAVEREVQLYPWLLRTYQSVFGTVMESYVQGSINKVLLCRTEPGSVSPLELRTAAVELQKRIPLDFDLASLAVTYRDASSARPSKNVLTDDFAPVNLMRLKKADEKDWDY